MPGAHGKEAALEQLLAREIESHTCPICYELMVPPEHSPYLLFPCGHSFCSACISKHTDGQAHPTCPYCRQAALFRHFPMRLFNFLDGCVFELTQRAAHGLSPPWQGSGLRITAMPTLAELAAG